MLEILQYSFMQRAFIAGIMVAIICSAIGTFIVLKRLSMIGDGLAHIALGGVALGLFFNVYPIITALLFSAISALGINRLRKTKVHGDVAIAIFFSAGLAVAVVLLSLANGFNVNLFSYLFGSILTVNETDLQIVMGLGILTVGAIILFYKEFVYLTFDEESAIVSGIPVDKLNDALVILTAITVVVSIKIVGILLVSSLLVVPTAISLQISKNFKETILFSTVFAILSVVTGLISSYYFNIATGGAIVLVSIIFFIAITLYKNYIIKLKSNA
ncbi:MAG: metal ABC transporter permease [Candidatus Methanoperedens sp.]|nr:metal ABC transporter permease [Candidatus Methanoperedens sp.]